jgi:hypothetical protein
MWADHQNALYVWRAPNLEPVPFELDHGFDEAVNEFLGVLWRSYSSNISLLHPHASVDIHSQDNVVQGLMAGDYAADLNLIVSAANGTLLHNAENVLAVQKACRRVTDVLYGLLPIPYDIPEAFSSTQVGSLWWRALLWCEQNELISLLDAALILGVSVQAVSASRKLQFFVDPFVRGRAGRRLVRRSDVLALRQANRKE